MNKTAITELISVKEKKRCKRKRNTLKKSGKQDTRKKKKNNATKQKTRRWEEEASAIAAIQWKFAQKRQTASRSRKDYAKEESKTLSQTGC